MVARQTTVSAFDLTVWAYKRQMVQYEVDRHSDFLPGRERGNLIDELLAVSRGYDGRGCINGAGTSAALAAHVIHAHVRGLPSKAQQLVIKSGASGKPPQWNPIVPPARVTPVWIGRAGTIERRSRRLWDVVVNGRLKHLYGVTRKGRKSHEPVGCLIDYVGTPPAIAAAMIEAARNDYLIWWHGLSDLATIFGIDPRLAGFKVEGIGVPREPWGER
jgi:hypothetical protein